MFISIKQILKTAFILGCFLWGYLSFAQNEFKKDSLLRELETQKEDTLKVNTFNELAWEFRKTDAAKAKDYATQAIELSNSLAFKRGEITGRVRLGQIANIQKEYEKAEQIFLGVLKDEIKENYPYGIGRARSALSEIYINKGNLNKALDYGLDALKTFEDINDKKAGALITNKIGGIYEEMGFYDKAMEYFIKSVDIRQQLGDEKSSAFSYLDIGIFYKTLEDYDKAIGYLNKSEAIFKKLKDNYELSKVYSSMGSVHFKLENYNTALSFYNKSLMLKEQLGLADKDPSIYNNIGIVYFQKNDLDLASDYYMKSISIIENNVSENVYTDIYNNIGDLYYREKNYKEAAMYYEKALKLAEESNERTIQLKILNGLYRSYEKLGQYHIALQYNNRYIKLNQRIEQTYKTAVKLRANYEEQQKENAILEKDKELLISNNKRKQTFITSLITGIVLLSVLFFAVLKIRHQKQSIKHAEKDRRLKEQEIEDLLKDQELKFKDAVIEGQEKEQKRIAKDLHDSLGSMLFTAKIYFNAVEEHIKNLNPIHKNQYIKASDLLDSACTAVRKIAHNMNAGVLMDFGLVTALTDLKNTLEETKRVKVDFIAHGLTKRLDNKLEINLYKIIQELINNILKHADAGKVTIQLLKSNSVLNVIVEDNGTGFNPNHRKPAGMGLENVASRVDVLEGTLNIDSSPGNGTTVTMDIPLIND